MDPQSRCSARTGRGFGFDDPDDVLAGTDALATRSSGMPLAITSADCVPSCSRRPRAVVVAHAGWRGLAAGILAGAVALFERPGDVAVAIGPAIGRTITRWGAKSSPPWSAPPLSGVAASRPGERSALDLVGTARGMLERAGVGDVGDTGLCTACERSGSSPTERRGAPPAGRSRSRFARRRALMNRGEGRGRGARRPWVVTPCSGTWSASARISTPRAGEPSATPRPAHRRRRQGCRRSESARWSTRGSRTSARTTSGAHRTSAPLIAGARWHYIGNLQSHTALGSPTSPTWWRRSHPSERLAGWRDARPSVAIELPALIEVDFTGGRTGVPAEALDSFAAVVAQLEGLARRAHDASPCRSEPRTPAPISRRLRELAERLQRDHSSIAELSHGNVGDYEVAVEEGATMVRIGTALFGERTPST